MEKFFRQFRDDDGNGGGSRQFRAAAAVRR